MNGGLHGNGDGTRFHLDVAVPLGPGCLSQGFKIRIPFPATGTPGCLFSVLMGVGHSIIVITLTIMLPPSELQTRDIIPFRWTEGSGCK